MCGILNVITKNGNDLDLAACRRALSYLTWRGPDLTTYKAWDNRVFWGQTILSLTGDINNTDKHLSSVSGRFHLVFNGEIYNFRELESGWLKDSLNFISHGGTDSQVLVNLHEVLHLREVPRLLDGMYAYSLLDMKERTISICRDIQGEKSLYVYEDSKLIVISSEIRPILSLVPSIKPDPQILRDYFHTRHFMFFERTLYPGIRQLLPGHIETINVDTMHWSKHCYQELGEWVDPDTMDKYSKSSIDTLTDELESLMESCIKQMIPKQRKYAAVVSGGVDSSLIAHYLVKHGKPDLLVAVNHVGKDRISSDLSGFERVLGNTVNVIDVDVAAYSSEIPRCQQVCGSPLLSHSFVGQSIQSKFVQSAGCRVLFGGEGADELLGGYPCYHNNRSFSDRFSPSPYTIYNDSELEFIGENPMQLQYDLSEAWKRSLKVYENVKDPGERIAQAMMFCDFAWQLPSVGLRGADLMSMMWSVETRSVFIRRPIVKFALNLPVSVKSDATLEASPILRAKPLLKKLFLRYFPTELLQEKQGFAGFPNESAIYLGDISDFLAFDVLKINPQSVTGRVLDKDTIWKLVNIEYFLRRTS